MERLVACDRRSTSSSSSSRSCSHRDRGPAASGASTSLGSFCYEGGRNGFCSHSSKGSSRRCRADTWTYTSALRSGRLQGAGCGGAGPGWGANRRFQGLPLLVSSLAAVVISGSSACAGLVFACHWAAGPLGSASSRVFPRQAARTSASAVVQRAVMGPGLAAEASEPGDPAAFLFLSEFGNAAQWPFKDFEEDPLPSNVRKYSMDEARHHTVTTEDDDMKSLRSCIAEVQRSERSRKVANLLRLSVLHEFEQLRLPLVQPLSGIGGAKFGPNDLRSLATGFYPEDALELIKDHVLSIIGPWEHLVREYPLQLSLFQAGKVYSLSAIFGYALRRAVMRYRLDQLAGGPGAEERSLQDYVAFFGPAEMLNMVSVTSREAQAVLDDRVSALFGNLEQLGQEFHSILDALPSGEAGTERVTEAIKEGKVESVKITVADLRRLVLEGTAFGFVLGNSEARFDSMYDLTSPGSSGALRFDGSWCQHG